MQVVFAILGQIALYWLYTVALLYFAFCCALLFDQERILRNRLKTTCGDVSSLLITLAAAPIVLALLLPLILLALPKFMWNTRVAGCFLRNRPPIATRKTLSTRRSEWKEKRDQYRQQSAAEREMEFASRVET